MPDADDQAQPGPYGAHAFTYHRAGWSPLPLPPRAKKHPPEGWTGTGGAWPSGADVHAWTEDKPHGNIALRLPPNVIGVDVDAYGDKPGGLVLADLEQRLGALPHTWRSTSRDDGISGIRFYTVPEGLRWPSILGPGIEVIRHGHRYAVAWPSIHPDTGGTYRWVTPDGATALNDIPTPDTLPALPAGWVEHFTHGELAGDQARAGLTPDAAGTWLTAHTGGNPCRATLRALERLYGDLATATSRHDAALTGTNRLIWMAGLGHTGIGAALEQARNAFLAATGTDRTPGEAAAEWDRMISGAIDLAAAAHPTPTGADPCLDPFHGLLERAPQAATPATPTPSATAVTTTGNGSTPSKDAAPSPTSSSAASDADENAPSPSPTDPADPPQHLDPEQQQLYYLQELARLQARHDAQRHYDATFEDKVIADRIRRRSLDERAAREYKRQAAGAQDPPEPITLTALLAQPDEDVRYRVAGLWPVGGRIVLAAAAKAGKSTAVLNLVRCLVDDEPFLGTYDIHPPTGRVVVIDNELDPRQIRANYRLQGITNTDQVEIIALRGKVATFDILDPATRAEWAEKLREMGASVVIFDCLRPLIDALGLSEDKDAGRILVAFDALLNDACVEDGLVVHHMGHSGERSRGDTRIRDWPDAEWKIVKASTDDGENDDQAPRFFSAFGRDVLVPESQLELDVAARRLYLAGGSRAEAKLAPVIEAVCEVVEEQPQGVTTRGIEAALAESEHGRNEIRKAIHAARDKGLIEGHAGPRKAVIYTPVRQCATTAPVDTGALAGVRHRRPPKGGIGAVAPLEARGVENDSSAPPASKQLCTRCGAPLDDIKKLLGATLCPTCAATPTTRNRIVERVIAGERVNFDLDTGEIVDSPGRREEGKA